MKKEIIGIKSYKELIWIGVFLAFLIYIALSILTYYQFQFNQFPDVITILFFVVVVAFVALIIYGTILLLYPKVIIETNDQKLYVHRLNGQTLQINIHEIEEIKATINIWAKPFLVYTSIVIFYNHKSIVIRFVKEMKDVKDKIFHMMQLTDKEA